MAQSVRVKVNTAGIGELLRSAELRADLEHRMGRVLAQASASAPEGIEYVLESTTTDRARVSVGSRSKGALFLETKTGKLARALQAAGGS